MTVAILLLHQTFVNVCFIPHILLHININFDCIDLGTDDVRIKSNNNIVIFFSVDSYHE